MRMPIRHLLRLALIIAALPAAIPAFAVTELAGCAAKRESIQHQLSQADGDSERIAGLEKTLDGINAHCRDSALTKQRNKKIISAQVNVNEAQRALHRAQSEPRAPEKIARLQAKLDRAKAELAEAEAALKR
jgi:pyruvate-formate lyase